MHAWMPASNLSNAVYKDCHINAANLFAANLSGIVLESSHEEGFSAINLANLEEADMTGASMRNISAEECNMKKTNLTGADLTHAVLSGTIMRHANVAGTNFQDVELASVTMCFANFSDALNANIPSFKRNLR